MRVRVGASRPAGQAVREFFSRMAPSHGPVVQIRRRELPYWQERAWVRALEGFRTKYSGSYHTAYGSFHGTAEERGSNHFKFLIYRPPAELRVHRHWVCFLDRGQGWFEVHMGRQPADISSGILTIERLITEAFEQ
jgi:hypothetical protein